MSLPEILLWSEIRALGNPVHLRRQFPISGLTVDFACRESKLVFEVDGQAFHSTEEDARRNTILNESGSDVTRIAARDVLRDPTSVAEAILGICRGRLTEKSND